MVFDLHNDLPTADLDRELKCEIAGVAAAEGNIVIYAVWTSEIPDPLPYIRSEFGTGIYGKLFSIEDSWFVNERNLDEVIELSPLYCTLTHNGENALAGGALSDGALTKLGRKVVRRMSEAGIAIDTAHLNKRSFYEVIEISGRLLDSHTGLTGVYEHPRNLDDGQVRLLIEREGIIGLTAVRDFIGGSTVKSFVELIDSFVQKFGIERAAIGTDFFGTKPLDGLGNYDDFATVSIELMKLGYSREAVKKIFFTNANTFFQIGDKKT